MREITILSGKGGTGKTSITAALATLTKDTVLCDTDVNASNLHLILKPEVVEQGIFLGGWSASINTDKCIHCGICALHCQFDAIHTNEQNKFYVNQFQCEGCRLCEKLCPTDAITSKQSDQNLWYISKTRYGSMAHAEMEPGEDNSGKLVTWIRNKAREEARSINAQWIINDGPPGVGCSTIASLTGVDALLIVTEPSLSGIHDAKRVVELAQSFQIPIFALINKYDLELSLTQQLTDYFKQERIQLLGLLPFDEKMVEAIIAGEAITEFAPQSTIALEIKKVWNQLDKQIPHSI